MPADTRTDTATTLRPARLGRHFHRLWAGESVSLLGNATASVFVPLVAVVGLDASPTWMGLLTACAWLPWFVIGLPAGAWVDRQQPRRVMIGADLVAAAAAASVPVAWFLDALTLPHLVAAAFVGGTCTVFFRAAYPRLVRAVTEDGDAAAAFGRLTGTESFMQVAGPGVAGALLAVLHAATGLLLDAISFLVSAAFLRRMPSVELDESAPEPLRRRIAQGLRTTVADPFLRFSLGMGGASNFGLTGYGALLVLYLVDLGLDGGSVGTYFMIAALGGVIGSALGAPLARRIGTGRASTVLLLGAPVSFLIGLPTQRSQLWLSLLGYILVGVMVVAGNVVRSSWRQRYVPRDLLGRAVTATSTVNYGTMPLAGALSGWLGTAVGVRTSILLMAGVHVIACWLVVLSPLVRLRELPLPESEEAAAERPG